MEQKEIKACFQQCGFAHAENLESYDKIRLYIDAENFIDGYFTAIEDSELELGFNIIKKYKAENSDRWRKLCGVGLAKIGNSVNQIETSDVTYFLDHSYDEVIPLGANSELVDKYEELLKQDDSGINLIRCDTKDELLDIAIEQSHYAKDGGQSFKMLSDQEMQELIKEQTE